MHLKALLTGAVCALPFSVGKPSLLRILGHKIGPSVRISMSLIFVRNLYLESHNSIGLFNVIKTNRLVMRDYASVGAMNHIHGDFSVRLGPEAAIGNRNRINRGPYDAPHYPSSLSMGRLSKITADHYVNLISPIKFGDYSILGGSRSQMWTHGFVHHAHGPGRDEVRRPITVGDNVYIGSMCCISPGVTLGNHVAIGAHSSVSKSLSEPGMYVSQALRFIPHRSSSLAPELRSIE